ncbi:hypothetical protein [Stutzerimonas nitrititolerans]|uniref:hypothetical protein n=1 Tax=Stutzerimonas nitrititolerans TaxID=2482751 RepID=UPI0028A936CF|nr:hypothetical protein [Stutzerimonas nitrititolerans]
MTFPAYPQYKDSGIESLGEIPSHWDVTRLPYVIFENNAGEVIDKNFWGDGSELLYTCAKQPLLSDFRDFPARKRTGANDLLLTRNGTPYVHLPSEGAIYSNVVQRVSLIPGIDRKFMRSALDVATRDLVGYGVSIASFNYEMWAALRIPLPDYEEQTQIARFLDHETARIDALIEEQQRLIELLKEKRQAVISHAVTKGLDPKVPMKDSGVEWLGEVPANWAIKRLKQLVIDATGIQMGPFGGMLLELNESDTGYKVFGQENTISGNFSSGNRWISEQRYFALSNYHLEVGDIVLTRKGSLGNCRRVSFLPQAGIIDSDTIRVRAKEQMMSPDYLELLLHEAGYISTQLGLVKRGAILSGLNSEIIANLVIAAPPLKEQEELLREIKAVLSRFDQGISDCDYAIGLLRERRSALISAAVTGKIDVRGWQPPPSTQAPKPAVAEAV